MLAVADSSFLVAVAINTDQAHEPCTEVYLQQMGKIFVPQTTLAESAYLMTREGGNRVTASFLRRLPETKYQIEALEPEDVFRTAQILERYADSRVDFVDATVIALAERKKATRILTLDRRDFSIVRPSHIAHFELLPQT